MISYVPQIRALRKYLTSVRDNANMMAVLTGTGLMKLASLAEEMSSALAPYDLPEPPVTPSDDPSWRVSPRDYPCGVASGAETRSARTEVSGARNGGAP